MENTRFTKDELDRILSILEVAKWDVSLDNSACDTIDRFVAVFDNFYKQYNEYTNNGVDDKRISCEIQPHFMVSISRKNS